LPRPTRAGIFTGQVETMTLRKLTAALLTLLAMTPVLAAGRPACCAKKAAPAVRGCCAGMAASAPKGCCKPPEAPKPAASASAADAPALVTVAPTALPSSEVASAPTEAEAVRIARLDHRAPSPTDSPPDLLTLHRALLI
jgi:hypothetical protein